jgi:hypothetical protein
MLIDTDRARYMLAVAEAIEAGRTDIDQLTDVCPQCGDKVNVFDITHTVISQLPPTHPKHATSIDAYVVIGCEDYWVMNPNSIGIVFPNLMPWDAAMSATTGDGYPITDDVVDAMNAAEGVNTLRDLG